MSDDRNLFRQFIGEMDSMLRENERDDGRDQKTLLNELFILESRFKKTMLSHESGRVVYKKFMTFILEEKGNILSARVYFRERQDTFTEKLFKAFHRKNSRMLHKFRINFLFVKWAMDHYKGPHKKILNAIMKQMLDVRHILCQNNLPLAINRAKIFWSHVPQSHMEYMDFIQAASEGLVSAIDKFVPPYKTVFRSTAIGRMTLNMLTDYNDTLVKIPPKEKRILYRANVAKRKKNLTDQSKVVDYVNESFEGVTGTQLSEIEAAASHVVDLNQKPDDGEGYSLVEKLADESENVEQNAMDNEQNRRMKSGLKKLEVIEKKVVYLKNGDV